MVTSASRRKESFVNYKEMDVSLVSMANKTGMSTQDRDYFEPQSKASRASWEKDHSWTKGNDYLNYPPVIQTANIWNTSDNHAIVPSSPPSPSMKTLSSFDVPLFSLNGDRIEPNS